MIGRCFTMEPGQTGVTPTEDLMREHGALQRILQIYKRTGDLLIHGKSINFEALNTVLYNTAVITQNFIDNYHQVLEENYIFPIFRNAGKQLDCIEVLLEQHQASRNITGAILRLTQTFNTICFNDYRNQLEYLLLSYVQMYEPHTGREDTVLFPEVRELISPKDFDDLGELFEQTEEKMFGENGFQRIVNNIAVQEQSLGIYNLSQFTPRTADLTL